MDWKKFVLLGEPTIDNHHVQLLAALAKIKEARTLSKEEFLKHITFLNDYTIYHFDYEENLMKQYDYPLYEQHKKIHDYFVKRIDKWVEDFNNMHHVITEEELDEAIQFEVDWLRKHIMTQDKKFIEFKNKYKD